MKQWLVRRGLVATLPLAALVAFGLDACSSEPGDPTSTSAKPGASAQAQQTAPEHEIAPSLRARDRLSRIGQFKRFVMLPKVADPSQAATGGPQLAPAKLEPIARAVVAKGDAEHFVVQGERIRAQVSDLLKRQVNGPASVDLPKTAGGFVRFQADDGSAGIEFTAKGVKADVPFETADGLVNYPSAAPGGGDMVLRISADAVEDYVVLNEKPEQPFVDYTVKVGEVAGLRLVENALEFLAKDGNPQARVRPPEVFDADGVNHHAKLSVLGCAVDTSALAPWDRPVTAPGASECTLRVSWDDAKVVYPAIVDPVWTSVKDLTFARYRNASVKSNLTNFVITCGGIDNNGDPLKTCEQYNHGTNTWTTIASLKTARSQFTMLAIGNDVLALGDSTLYTSELFSAGAWTATATDFSVGAGYLYLPSLMPAVTSDGAWVVLVDYNGKPYRYQVSTKTWTAGTANGVYRSNYETLVQPTTGAIMRCGGTDNSFPSVALKTCEKYLPGSDTWVMPGAAGAVVNMNAARSYAAWASLDASSVMLYGGYNPVASSYITTAEIYSGTSNTWTSIGSIPNSVYEYYLHNTWAPHTGSGRILSIASGVTSYDPPTKTWTTISNYDDNNNYFYVNAQDNTVAAAGTRVIVVPVTPSGLSGAQTACKIFDVGAKGAQCNSTGECGASLNCVKESQYDVGYCCDTTCTDPCQSCRAELKQSGTGTGTCGPRSTTSYIGYNNPTTCVADGTTCGVVGGYCDGAGGCLKAANTTYCGYQSCVDGDTQNNNRLCDGKGVCAAQTTTDCTAGYACLSNYSSCVNFCYDDSYCTSSYYCQYWSPPAITSDKCQPKKANGATCTNTNSECSSGFCVDGVCCDKACNGTCEACTAALTGGTNGACKAIPAGQASGKECVDQGAGTCGTTGLCDGASGCQKYANGTQCADIGSCATESSRYVPDTCNGTGSCVDKGTQSCTAGYSCQAGVCNTQCTSDAMCASAYYCDIPNKACVPDKAPGQSCLRDQACQGNSNCVEIDAVSKLGVCCNSACSGDCQSCLKVNNGNADGTCDNVLDDLDPKNKCTQGAAYPNSCAGPGLCNGQGACRAYAKTGIECDTDVCTDSTLTTYQCNGAGTCKAQSTQCYPFKCDTANNVCRVACSIDAHCVTGSSCENGTCVGQLGNGAACSRGPQCKTGFCANIHEGLLQGQDTGAGGDGAGGAAGDPGADAPGVCCDTECQGTCSGCKASIKGFGSDGVCEFVKNNTDPANDCEKSATDACGLDGQCNGAGACRLAPTGTSCGASSCQGNSVLGQSCNGQGDCINNQGGIDCAPYVCRDVLAAFQCTNPCADDNDCQDGYFCSDAKCSKKLANGKACDSNGICGSGYCVDSVCCDAACNGQCEACAAPGSEGTCTPVQGEPQGMRPKCDHAGQECGGQCDGVNAAACKYAPNGDACGTTTCDNGLAKSSVCNGQGECKANKDAECSPYVCGTDDTCLARCEQDADCSEGYACNATTQRCLPSASAATCSDDRLTSQGQNGDTPCKPFLCVPASGTCAVSCAFTTDCSPDFVCEPSTKTCLPAPADSGSSNDTSCACRAAGAAPKSSGYLALAALGVALTGLRRRRRSHKPAPTSAKPRGFASASQPSE